MHCNNLEASMATVRLRDWQHPVQLAPCIHCNDWWSPPRRDGLCAPASCGRAWSRAPVMAQSSSSTDDGISARAVHDIANTGYSDHQYAHCGYEEFACAYCISK